MGPTISLNSFTFHQPLWLSRSSRNACFALFAAFFATLAPSEKVKKIMFIKTEKLSSIYIWDHPYVNKKRTGWVGLDKVRTF